MRDLHQRVTISLPSRLIIRLDRQARLAHSSRSRIVAELLEAASTQQADKSLVEEIEHYYMTRTSEEANDDESLANASIARARQMDLDALPRHRGRRRNRKA